MLILVWYRRFSGRANPTVVTILIVENQEIPAVVWILGSIHQVVQISHGLPDCNQIVNFFTQIDINSIIYCITNNKQYYVC